ncbi:hypothetical protein [Arenicella xantha]|uniref:Nuclear transport factor 2 family protein n=1 Tax=Arenicella xantha TaxID=644221 RepID=A0A395JF64_9GAMM|nr:hypothetical protein [Arenicella xantha]RBP48422.1 hypothetical protein DFR28_10724 [Arenicella xantha]
MQSLFRTCFILATLITILSACGGSNPDDPETQVKAVLASVEEAAERRSLSGVMDHISDDYLDHTGQDKKSIARLVQLQILRNQKINAFSLIRSIEITENLASVELSVSMSAREDDLSNESNRLRADGYRFSILLALEGNDWKIRSVSWKQGW